MLTTKARDFDPQIDIVSYRDGVAVYFKGSYEIIDLTEAKQLIAILQQAIEQAIESAEKYASDEK